MQKDVRLVVFQGSEEGSACAYFSSGIYFGSIVYHYGSKGAAGMFRTPSIGLSFNVFLQLLACCCEHFTSSAAVCSVPCLSPSASAYPSSLLWRRIKAMLHRKLHLSSPISVVSSVTAYLSLSPPTPASSLSPLLFSHNNRALNTPPPQPVLRHLHIFISRVISVNPS